MVAWSINVDPFGNLTVSALVAAIPILFLFIALAVLKMKAHFAGIIATALSGLIAIYAYGMPSTYACLSILYGAMYGLFPVCWIVITALFIYNLSVKTGQFEVIKNSLAAISDDRRIQALLIAFAFGAFLEGAAGFGTPVAITAAMLAGLGFKPLYAAGICLLANTAPVAFGAVGIPILVAAGVSGLDAMAVSQMVGRTLPFVSLVIPLYLVILMAGWEKSLDVWPACIVAGVSFAVVQYLSSNYLSPLLPDILSSLASLLSLFVLLRFWHPEQSWHFPDEAPGNGRAALGYSCGQVFRAWSPFILLSIFVAAWGIQPIKTTLDQLFVFKLPIAGLDNMVIDHTGKPKAAVYLFNGLSTAGTAILLAWFFSIPVMGASIKTALESAGKTLKQMWWPIVTISTVIGFSFIMNYSGMAITLAYMFAAAGWLFPFFAAFLGWLGVFMTGSDTSANALFGKLQAVTAEQISVNPLVTVSANTAGGVCGKMISPQSISVASAAIHMVGNESEIFRFTLKHSLILTAVIGCICMLQAYVFPGIIPTGEKGWPSPSATALGTATNKDGILYLGVTFAAAIFVSLLSRIVGRDLIANGDKTLFD